MLQSWKNKTLFEFFSLSAFLFRLLFASLLVKSHSILNYFCFFNRKKNEQVKWKKEHWLIGSLKYRKVRIHLWAISQIARQHIFIAQPHCFLWCTKNNWLLKASVPINPMQKCSIAISMWLAQNTFNFQLKKYTQKFLQTYILYLYLYRYLRQCLKSNNLFYGNHKYYLKKQNLKKTKNCVSFFRRVLQCLKLFSFHTFL